MTLRTSRIVFGAMAHAGASSDDARVELMRAAIDAGITSLDTAPIYGLGRSERLIGRAIEGLRDRVQLLTKVGLRWGADARGDVLFETPEATVRKDSRPEMVRRDVEESLERIGVERLDLVQVHHPDPHTPIEETFSALADLCREGRVGAVGASNFSVDQLEAAQRGLGDVSLFSTQERYSLVYREVEAAQLPYCRERGLSLLAYSPLAQGILAGKLLAGGSMPAGDFRAEDPSFRPANLRQIHRAMRASLDPIATDRGAPLASVALAWLAAEPGVVPVAGAKSPEQLDGLVRATRMELSVGERSLIRAAFEATRVDRGPAGLRARVRRLAGRLFGG